MNKKGKHFAETRAQHNGHKLGAWAEVHITGRSDSIATCEHCNRTVVVLEEGEFFGECIETVCLNGHQKG